MSRDGARLLGVVIMLALIVSLFVWTVTKVTSNTSDQTGSQTIQALQAQGTIQALSAQVTARANAANQPQAPPPPTAVTQVLTQPVTQAPVVQAPPPPPALPAPTSIPPAPVPACPVVSDVQTTPIPGGCLWHPSSPKGFTVPAGWIGQNDTGFHRAGENLGIQGQVSLYPATP